MTLLHKLRGTRESKLMDKANTRVEKELDLQKVLHRLRLVMFVSLGLLKTRQSNFVDKISRIVVRESVGSKNSSDNELSEDAERDFLQSSKRMMQSNSKTDKRFINIYKIINAKKSRVSLGFQGIEASDLAHLPE